MAKKKNEFVRMHHGRPLVRDDRPPRPRHYSAEWSKRMVESGRCASCGRPRNVYARYCDRCAEKHKERVRKSRQGGEWVPGKRGRPPKTVKYKEPLP